MGASDTAGTADVTELAAELYLVPPDRFVAVRDDVVRTARRAGYREVADQLQQLRRPTRSAWLVNVLARHDREAMRELAALGRELRQAQTQLDGGQLRRLSTRRRELVCGLVELARERATEAGVAASDRVLDEVEATLHAALVDLAAVSAVLSGRLVRAMSHHGFGPKPQVAAGRVAPEAPGTAFPPATAAGRPPMRLTLAPAVDPGHGTPAGPTRAAAQAAGAGPDEWIFWPVPLGPAERPAADSVPLRRPGEASGEDGDAPAEQPRPRRLRLVTSPDDPELPQPSPTGVEPRLAAAESEHWHREQELAAAEEALRAAREELEWFEEHRTVARSEKAAAERRVAQARTAQQASVRALVAARRTLDAAESRLLPGPEGDED
jgi:hypothetical protein